MAECSLSTGRRSPPPVTMARRMRCPAITSASLLAMATGLPASSADIVGSSPAAPPVPASTMSTSSATAISSMGSQEAPADRDSVVEGGITLRGEDVAGTEVGDLLGEAGGVASRGEGRDLEELGQLANDIDGLASDGAGGTEDGDTLRRHTPIVARTRAGVCDPPCRALSEL